MQKATIAGAYGVASAGIMCAATELTAHAKTKLIQIPLAIKNSAGKICLGGWSLDSEMKHPAKAASATIITSAPTSPSAPTSKAANPTCTAAVEAAVAETGSAI